MPEKWTNRSRPPSSGVMKPKPLSSLNHFTVPVAITSPCTPACEHVQMAPRSTSKRGYRSRARGRTPARETSWSAPRRRPRSDTAPGSAPSAAGAQRPLAQQLSRPRHRLLRVDLLGEARLLELPQDHPELRPRRDPEGAGELIAADRRAGRIGDPRPRLAEQLPRQLKMLLDRLLRTRAPRREAVGDAQHGHVDLHRLAVAQVAVHAPA